MRGITDGFQVGYNDHRSKGLRSSRKNIDGAIQHPEVVDEYLAQEMTFNRLVGPFVKAQLPSIQISRFGVIPKSHQMGKRRLIVDLSHPKSYSVNDGIPKSLCGLSYITVDDAINKVLELGPNTLMAKIDIKSALRLLPVHPADRHLPAMEWQNKIFLSAFWTPVCSKTLQHFSRFIVMDHHDKRGHILHSLPGRLFDYGTSGFQCLSTQLG